MGCLSRRANANALERVVCVCVVLWFNRYEPSIHTNGRLSLVGASVVPYRLDDISIYIEYYFDCNGIPCCCWLWLSVESRMQSFFVGWVVVLTMGRTFLQDSRTLALCG